MLITNLKVLVEEEGETTVREVVKDMEVEAMSLLVLVVTMIVQMEASVIVCLNLISLVNNYLLLILAVVSCVLLLIILGLMVYLEFISFVCKKMLSVILILIDFLFRIYLQGRSNTLLKSRY